MAAGRRGISLESGRRALRGGQQTSDDSAERAGADAGPGLDLVGVVAGGRVERPSDGFEEAEPGAVHCEGGRRETEGSADCSCSRQAGGSLTSNLVNKLMDRTGQWSASNPGRDTPSEEELTAAVKPR